ASFLPLWRPPFLSQLTAGGRCHLNGVALEERRPRLVPAGRTRDGVGGWRDWRHGGGRVVGGVGGPGVGVGLSLPPSPRVERGRLWLLNSGTGQFGSVDPGGGAFVPLTFCPGYLRGLAFVGDYAVVGLSKPRHDRTFGGLALDGELERRGAEARCGLLVIDLR